MEIKTPPSKKDSSNIQDAKIISETKINPVAIPSEKLGTKQVDTDTSKKSNDPVEVDFMGSDFAQQQASQPTKESDDYVPKISGDKPLNEVKKEINDFETNKDNNLTFKDFTQLAGFLIGLFDGAISIALNWFAGDTSSSYYALSKPQKQQLTEQLAMILCKYQVKFKIEFMLFLSIVVMYSAPALAAVKKRKETKGVRPARQRIKTEEKKPEKEKVKETTKKTEESLEEIKSKLELKKEEKLEEKKSEHNQFLKSEDEDIPYTHDENSPIMKRPTFKKPTSRPKGGQKKP